MKTKFILLFAILIATSVADQSFDASTCSAAGKKTSTKASRYQKYTGTIGNSQVTVYFDSNLNGYYYTTGSKNKIKLKGNFIESIGPKTGQYIIYEYGSTGEVTATWDVEQTMMWVGTGKYYPMIEGTKKTKSGRTYEISLY